MTTTLSDDDILKLYRDKYFSGSYRGIRTFQALLKTDRNIEIPLKRLYSVVRNDPIYLMHVNPTKIFQRRKYIVRSVQIILKIEQMRGFI